jgi:hypothetical protein
MAYSRVRDIRENTVEEKNYFFQIYCSWNEMLHFQASVFKYHLSP